MPKAAAGARYDWTSDAAAAATARAATARAAAAAATARFEASTNEMLRKSTPKGLASPRCLTASLLPAEVYTPCSSSGKPNGVVQQQQQYRPPQEASLPLHQQQLLTHTACMHSPQLEKGAQQQLRPHVAQYAPRSLRARQTLEDLSGTLAAAAAATTTTTTEPADNTADLDAKEALCAAPTAEARQTRWQQQQQQRTWQRKFTSRGNAQQASMPPYLSASCSPAAAASARAEPSPKRGGRRCCSPLGVPQASLHLLDFGGSCSATAASSLGKSRKALLTRHSKAAAAAVAAAARLKLGPSGGVSKWQTVPDGELYVSRCRLKDRLQQHEQQQHEQQQQQQQHEQQQQGVKSPASLNGAAARTPDVVRCRGGSSSTSRGVSSSSGNRTRQNACTFQRREAAATPAASAAAGLCAQPLKPRLRQQARGVRRPAGIRRQSLEAAAS
ncbi:AF4/FMR2 family member 4 [Cyclospora cayetanensis]|uniref:AF4/FMR2 family member 4 n=1 Tax=Cyclospora cayetanensis TaxID=88456 RepID=A0A6P6RSJ7_9EIME|nr:AF4/FMR2 family member 4 [Cyclospora cayetanensis]